MNITAKEPRASESNHWYTRDGVPRYTVMGKNGKERNTTLRDARTENLIPSVTTILNVMAKPALIQWLQKQVLLALKVQSVLQVQLVLQVLQVLLAQLLPVLQAQPVQLVLQERSKQRVLVELPKSSQPRRH